MARHHRDTPSGRFVAFNIMKNPRTSIGPGHWIALLLLCSPLLQAQEPVFKWHPFATDWKPSHKMIPLGLARAGKGGGSLLVRYLQSENEKETKYLAPAGSDRIMPLYRFIREHCATSLAGTKPCSLVNNPKSNWCLANPGYTYLVYALKGGTIALDLSDARETFTAKWLDPRTGELRKAGNGQVKGGQVVQFNAPDREDWALWLSQPDKS